jgi:cold shock CspA family protein
LNITFEAENSDYQIGIMDLQGRVVASQNLQSLSGAQTVEFEVSDLAKGSYIVTVTTNGLTKTQNVVIK